jgi:hypothetical protein
MFPSSLNSNLRLNREESISSVFKSADNNYISKVEDVNNLIESSLYNITQTEKHEEVHELDDDKSYYYQGLDCLSTDINELSNTVYGARVYICMYSVNTSAKHPFLEYLLLKNKHHDIYPDIFTFPMFLYYKDLGMDILNESDKLRELLLLKIDETKFKGYLLEETNGMNDVYLFYELDKSLEDIGKGEIYRNNLLWKVTMDEMVNSRLVCNFQIDDSVTVFFIKNSQFMFLYKYDNNENNIIYETPTVVYNGVDESKLYFTYVFGVPKTSYEAIMGPFYYFTDYRNAIKMSMDSIKNSDEISNKKIAIIRSVVFLGINKVPMNYPEDKHDESETNSILTSLDNSNADTNRISDHNGLWSNTYDSVYLGKLLLDNGKTLEGGPLWVVKSYEQQASLSYHYLSSKILGYEWDENNQYFIL